MDTFNYLSVLFSVIMGLALTQILQGLRVLMLERERVTIYWPALIWAALMILLVAQAWWAMFEMRTFSVWNFAMYAVVLLQVVLLYLAAGLVMPDVAARGPIDMRENYFAHARWFFSLMALIVVATTLKDAVTTGHLNVSWNAFYLDSFFVLAVIAALTKSRWYHAALAPFSVATVAVYTALLSARL